MRRTHPNPCLRNCVIRIEIRGFEAVTLLSEVYDLLCPAIDKLRPTEDPWIQVTYDELV